MYRNSFRARVDEVCHVALRPLDQKVDVQAQVRGATQACDHGLADRDLRHKVAVHHVHVNHGTARSFDDLQCLSQTCEVG